MKEQSEIENLLKELQNMKHSRKTVENNSATWEKIRAKDWEGAGFANEEEAKQWVSENPYANM